MKVFVVGGATNYANFLEEASLVNRVEDADVVLFTGGEDVDPSLYGCEKDRYTHSNKKRDLAEKKIFESVKPTQLCLGICRGSQFLCVMNGGILVQHCWNHAIGYTHEISDGDTLYQITSTHHQMQYPYNLNGVDYDVLFTTEQRRSHEYVGEKIDQDTIIKNGEPEIVLYHKEGFPKCLAVQGHPEMIPDSPVAKMISDLVKRLIDENK